MSLDAFDDSKSAAEELAIWASWDNAPKSLEAILNICEEIYNQPFINEMPYILTLAQTAIRGHSPEALSVILNHTNIDLKETMINENPAIASLIFESLNYDSQKCMYLLFKHSDLIFEDEKTSSTYLNIGHIKEQRLFNDSGIEDLSQPASPIFTSGSSDDLFNGAEIECY